ncbi:MAG: hypothetical protein K9G59_15730 [Caulobacter sp.]|nr:hypothetical protein [Caulobacter sp.]
MTSAGMVTTEGHDARGVMAQSVGGGGGTGGFSLSVGLAGGGVGAGSGSVGVGGSGGDGGVSGEVIVTSTGDFMTSGDRATAIFAQSVGGGGGAGGWSGSLAVAGGGTGAGAVGVAIGGSAGGGGAGGKVTIGSHGQIVTEGVDAYGIFAQSVGGGGGTGGFSLGGAGAGGGTGAGSAAVGVGGSGGKGGASGEVAVTNKGNIFTSGDRSAAIFAQAVGGGGGAGGWTGVLAVAGGGSGAGAVGVSVGGSAGDGGAGGKVVVTSHGQIVTHGVDASGVFAQSVGGGGGVGGFSLAGAGAGGGSGAGAGSVGVGGSGGLGGDSGQVDVGSTGNILTTGDRSSGIFAQGVGGGGGAGGWTGALAIAGGGSGAGAIGVSVGGSGGGGGAGGKVVVSSAGQIVTQGADSHGVMAQSVGGGGGAGGFSLAGAGAGGGSGAGSGSVSIGGSGAGGGSADTVNVTITGEIGTSGARSAGVFAQSVGGGGGNGGWSGALALAGGGKGAGAVGVSVGGSAGLGGDGKVVDVTNSARISTTGVDAAGLLAQSIGGGGGTGGFAIGGAGGLGESAGAAAITVGGGGGAGGSAGDVHVDSSGFVSTQGDRSYAIQAQSIGGGGGTGGFAGSITAALAKKVGGAISISVGGSGGVGGDAGDVFVTSLLGADTTGAAAHGLFAQSVGGGGGSGGFSISGALSTGDTAVGISAALGGGGGVGGDAGGVWVTADGVTTTSGDRAYAVFAQSVGGGGGDGGFAGALSGSISDKASVALGFTLGGAGGAAGDAGDVSVVNRGDVGTTGADSYAIFAQSVGGGGGTGGMAISAALGKSKSTNISVGLGGSGGAGGAAGNVSVSSSGLVITDGAGATAIFAQSVGGGGGAGGAAGAMAVSGSDSVNLAVNVGGHGGAGSTGGSVNVDNSGQIITRGESAHGVFAESIGGGGGHGGMAGIDENAWSEYMAGGSGTVSFGSKSQNISVALGGAGGTGDDGGTVTVANKGSITTLGAQSNVIYAQSVGGGGGDAGVATAASGAFGASKNGTYAIALGGSGGQAGDGGLVTVINAGALWSVGDGSAGILAQSVGGGGGAGGDARGFSMSFSNKDTKKSGLTSVNVSIGGKGGAAGDGGDVLVDNAGQIVTEGGQSVGVYAQSVGGGGGRGGLISTQGAEIVDILGLANKGEAKGGQIAIGGDGAGGGDGGLVTVKNSGLIMTLGQGAHAVFAQSVGGGGGDGGSGLAGDVSVGGQGGVAGDGGDVIVRNSGVIITQGDLARGVFAQSVGGGGGTGGATDYDGEDTYSYRQELSDTMGVFGNLTATKDLIESFSEPAWGIGIGGMGGSAGDGGDLTIENSGSIFTSGTLSHGVFAQSVGGGGGTGGEGVITSVGQIVFSGAGGSAGDGGDVTVTNSGLIQTEGFGAYGIFAQSIGGGGGVAGDMSLGIASWGDLTTYGGEDYSSYGSFSVNPLDGYGGDGGDVTVTNTGDIVILGEGGVGIFAQSVGGGGGLFGSAMGLAFAGSLGGWGDAGTVTVNQNGNVYVGGKNGTGALFQSQAGDGYDAQNIVVTLNGDVRGGSVYGKGVLIDGGRTNVINLLGTVSAGSNLAIVATGGDDTINSYEGVIGNIDLGAGVNAFNNYASSVLQTLDYVLLNGTSAPKAATSSGAIRALAIDPAAGLLTNEGVITPGGIDAVQVTLVAGSYNQTATATFLTDLDLLRTDLSGEIDRLNVTGWADVRGQFVMNFLNPGYARPGDHTATIINAGGPLTASSLTLTAPTSAVATFALKTTDHELNLNYVIDFSPGGLTANRTAVGDYINAVQDAGSSAEFSQVVAQLFFEPSQTALSNYYDSFSPETYGDQVAMAGFAVDRFADSMMTCPAAPGGESDRGCTWGRISNRSLTLDATAQDMAFKERSLGLSLGFEAVVAENWRFGVAASGEAVDSGITGRTSGSGERYQLGAVVKRMAGPFTFALAAGAGAGNLVAKRYVLLPSNQFIARGDQSLSFQAITARASWLHGDDEFYLKPIVELSGTSVSTDGFTETGAGPLNLVVPQQSTDSARASFKLEVGGEISQGETVARPFARIGVSNLVSGSDSPFTAGFEGAPGGVNPFDVKSRLDKTTFDTELGISAVGAWGSGRLGWSGQFGDRLSNQTFSVKVTMSF